jgi:hypothetical protein
VSVVVPDPLAGTVTHVAVLLAVHVHPMLVVSVSVPVDALGPTDSDPGATVKPQAV